MIADRRHCVQNIGKPRSCRSLHRRAACLGTEVRDTSHQSTVIAESIKNYRRTCSRFTAIFSPTPRDRCYHALID